VHADTQRLGLAQVGHVVDVAAQGRQLAGNLPGARIYMRRP
jgi:hypothetical protein